MKKLYIPMMLMAIAAIASCEKQSVVIDEPETGNGTYIYTIQAGVPEVKTSYADGTGAFSWSSGDAISVLFHKGDDNKFFTLTTTGTGSSASFSGAIDDGYEIGASDGDGSDKKIWALFPASANHTYTAGELPTFYVQPEVDFSATHFSANIPMCALLAAEGTISFENMVSAYKFVISDLDVTKVKLLVSNQTTFGLSGSWPVYDASGTYIVNYGYASPGSANSCLSLTSNVTSKTAVFYVPCVSWGTFQPIVTLYDANTDFVLKRMTASKSIDNPAIGSVKPVTISAPGTGAALLSEFGIDWATIDMYPLDNEKDAFPSSTDRISEWKVTSDATNIYFYYKIPSSVPTTRGVWDSYINAGYDTDNNAGTGGDNGYGLGGGLEAYSIIFPFTNNAGDPVTYRAGARSDNKTKVYNSSTSTFDQTSSSVVATYGSTVGSYSYVEARIPREKLGSPAANSTIRINVSFGSSATGSQTITLVD